MTQDFSYSDLIRYIRSSALHEHLVGGEEEPMYPDSGHFSCLQNQFFHLVLFPDFTLDYISPSVESVLGYTPLELTLRRIYQLIHPEDQPIVLLATKKIIEVVMHHISEIIPQKTVFSLIFRMIRKDGTVVRILNHDCVYKKTNNNQTWKSISVYTDISSINTSVNVEFGLMNCGDPLKIVFPDQELKNLSSFFTDRERQILSLLTAGKNSAEIGAELFISRHTVDTHRRQMLAKSHLCNTANLVAFALQNGLAK